MKGYHNRLSLVTIRATIPVAISLTTSAVRVTIGAIRITIRVTVRANWGSENRSVSGRTFWTIFGAVPQPAARPTKPAFPNAAPARKSKHEALFLFLVHATLHSCISMNIDAGSAGCMHTCMFALRTCGF